MSVQASSFHYSTPRMDGSNIIYSSVEIGFPSKEEKMIAVYAENQSDLLNTVYPYVPALMVVAVINKHGGIISGELPELAVPRQPKPINIEEYTNGNHTYMSFSFNGEDNFDEEE